MAAAFSILAAADTLDRIAVSVGKRVITASDIDREIRVTAFLNGTQPDFGAAEKKATAERLIEQKLIRAELETSRYTAPSAGQVAELLNEFRSKKFNGQQEYTKALADYGIREEDVKAALEWQRTLLLFIKVRFGLGVQVTDGAIREYFDKTVAPVARAARPGEEPSLDDYRDQIEEKLIGQRVDEEVDGWLKETRKRTEIVYHEEAFR